MIIQDFKITFHEFSVTAPAPCPPPGATTVVIDSKPLKLQTEELAHLCIV